MKSSKTTYQSMIITASTVRKNDLKSFKPTTSKTTDGATPHSDVISEG